MFVGRWGTAEVGTAESNVGNRRRELDAKVCDMRGQLEILGGGVGGEVKR